MSKYKCDLLGIPRDLLYQIQEHLRFIRDYYTSGIVNTGAYNEAVRLLRELVRQIDEAESTGR